jgi:hypothetical protein
MMRALAAFGAILSLSGCVTAGREGPPQADLLREARVEGYGPDIRSSDPDQTAFVAWLQDHVGDARASSSDGSLNILALSGGGAGGVFGAGAMKGLTLSGARPTFQIVTGVSTGALIAPFAFLGPDWDDELEAAYTGGASAQLLDSVGLFSLFRVGIVNDANLRKLVSDYISPELVAAVAAESAKGRILLVATTNLDAEAPVFWDMGAIARKGGEDARRMFIDVLVASSSVPGAFPPVMIPVRDSSGAHDEMHVDGGVTVPFFLFPDVAFISDEKFEQLNGARIYVIVNGQLNPVQRSSRANTIAITLRASNVALTRMTRTELLLASSFAQRQGLTLRFTNIPGNYPFSGPFDFEAEPMRKLFDYATQCARSGRLWLSSQDALERIGRAGSVQPDTQPCPAQ